MWASDTLIWIGGTLGTVYGKISIVALALTATFFLPLSKWRWRVEEAIADFRTPLRFFDLSIGDTHRKQRERRPVVPEKLWTYDETYLTSFARFALNSTVGPEHTALQIYVQSILRRHDILFAICLGVFATAMDLAIAQALAPDHPNGSRALWIGASMGFLYTVADVSENLKLAAIFKPMLVSREHKLIDVDPAEAAAANLLTRVKVVTLTCSGVGLLVYAALAIVGVALRPPTNPEPVPVPTTNPDPGAPSVAFS